MSSLSIAHVTSVIGGGMGTVFRVLLPAQVCRGDRVAIFARQAGPEDTAHFAGRGVQVRSITSLVSLARQLREFDIVHLHSADLALLLAGRLSGRTTVFTLHGLRAQTRALATVGLHRLPTLGGLRRRLKRAGLSLLLRHAMSQITSVSDFLAARAGPLYGVRPDRVKVVPNGIALEEFKGRPRDAGRSGAVVGWVGRLVPVKRVDLLLKAVAAAKALGAPPEMRVIVVGDGELRGGLEGLARSLGVSEIVDFVGFVPTPVAWLEEMDLFVFPSRDEGAALAVCEAMASGLPVLVMQDGGGVAELVNRSGCGLVLPDEPALAAAMVELLYDVESRRRMAELGVAFAAREFDPCVWAVRFDNVYRAAMV